MVPPAHIKPDSMNQNLTNDVCKELLTGEVRLSEDGPIGCYFPSSSQDNV